MPNHLMFFAGGSSLFSAKGRPRSPNRSHATAKCCFAFWSDSDTPTMSSKYIRTTAPSLASARAMYSAIFCIQNELFLAPKGSAVSMSSSPS